MCQRIHHVLLKESDPILYDHLISLGIEPQLYGLYENPAFHPDSLLDLIPLPISFWDNRRWIRVLFGREFPIKDVLILWDALFADSPKLLAVEYYCLAMLLYIRDDRMLSPFTAKKVQSIHLQVLQKKTHKIEFPSPSGRFHWVPGSPDEIPLDPKHPAAV